MRVNHFFSYLFPCNDLILVGKKIFQQLEFLFGQICGKVPAFVKNITGIQIQIQISTRQKIGVLGGLTPDNCADSHEELLELEGLCKIVICSVLKSGDLIIQF